MADNIKYRLDLIQVDLDDIRRFNSQPEQLFIHNMLFRIYSHLDFIFKKLEEKEEKENASRTS